MPITEAFIRAYNFGRHIELLQIKNEEKIAFQAHLFCLKENVALIPLNFLTLVGDGQKKYESGEDRIVLSREMGTWKIKGHGRGRDPGSCNSEVAPGQESMLGHVAAWLL